MKFCGSLKVIGSKEKCYKIGHMKHSCLLALAPKVAWITFHLFVWFVSIFTCVFIDHVYSIPLCGLEYWNSAFKAVIQVLV